MSESGINFVLSTSDLNLRNTLIQAIKETSGITPVEVGNTSTAQRAYYKEAPASNIIHAASPAVKQMLGCFCVCAAIEVDNPTEAVEKAQKIFRDRGYDSQINLQIEPELPLGFMTFLVVPALKGILLLFWPKNPDENAVKKFEASGEFHQWTDDDLKN